MNLLSHRRATGVKLKAKEPIKKHITFWDKQIAKGLKPIIRFIDGEPVMKWEEETV